MTKKKKFTIKRKTYKIPLTGDLEGAEVEYSKRVPVEFLLQMEGLTSATVGDLSPDDQRDIVRSFGDIVLVSWNLADEEGNDIPADADGVLSLDSEVFNAVIDAWKDHLVGDKNLDSAQPEQPASV